MENQHGNKTANHTSKGLAYTSILISIISLLISFYHLGLLMIGWIISIVLGVIALKKIETNPTRYGGKAIAISGIVISVTSIIVFIFFLNVIVPSRSYIVKRNNEANAIATLKTIKTAQAQYSGSHNGEYGTFDQLVEAGFLDNKFVGDAPAISGYVFLLKKVPKSTKGTPPFYSVNADPMATYRFGGKYFYTDSNISDIRVSDGKPATDSDPSL